KKLSMLSNIKAILKNSAIYGFGNLSTKLAGFILIPIYTSHFSVAEFGVLSMMEVTAQVIIAVFGLSLYQGFFRWYWDKGMAGRQKGLFFTVTMILIGVSLVTAAILFPLLNTISVWFFQTAEYSYLLKMMLIASLMQMVMVMPSTLLRLQEKAVLYTATNLIQLSVNLFFTIFFIIHFHQKVEGIYHAQIIGSVVYFLVLFRFIIKNSAFRFETKVLKDMLVFCYPLILSAISGVIFNVTDRYSLKILGDLQNVGIYSLGFKITNTLYVFVITSVMFAIQPMIYKKMDAPDNKRFYSKLMTYLTFGIMFFVLGVMLFGKEIIKVLAQKTAYWDAYQIIPFLAYAILFGMFKDIATTGLNITKKTKIIAITVALMAALNIALNFVFIPFLHNMGAALSKMLSQIVFFVIIYRSSQKVYPIPYEIMKLMKMLILGIALYFLSLLTNDMQLIWRLTIKTAMIASFPVILYFMNFYEKIELETMYGGWNKWRNLSRFKENLKTIHF
ncbi:MAG: polysaccharide biosynthesis C-terminal domain-containing protein, partial [Bacteroidota bacterium]|nr:polysaccharide biosynthesis C-terminal domain-containing protein [Bacteroidota bacterium]